MSLDKVLPMSVLTEDASPYGEDGIRRSRRTSEARSYDIREEAFSHQFRIPISELRIFPCHSGRFRVQFNWNVIPFCLTYTLLTARDATP